MQGNVLSVKQLNFYLKSVMESDPKLQNLYVKGEISNLKNHYASGHFYFTLKDNDAAINCIMFRFNAARVKFELQNGMGVILRGKVSVYEKDGQNRFLAEEIIPDGIGDIALKFEQTKEKLQKEGLFDSESKRPLPKFPKKIAVVTSDSGAAVRDIFNVLSRRWSLCEILMCPVAVQGESAVPEMIAALDRLYTLGDIDVCIIGRGGGSVEDLWAFNSEKLAYKIYESPFPIISAVGHETDFTICDFVADLRAPTPSAAAELAVPDRGEMLLTLSRYEEALKNALGARFENSVLRLEGLMGRTVIASPLENLVGKRGEDVDRLCERLCVAAEQKIRDSGFKFGRLAAELDALSPLKTLSRGFAVAENKGKTVNSVKQLEENDLISLRFADGNAQCLVKGVNHE